MRERCKQEKHYANNFESTKCKYTPIHTGSPLRKCFQQTQAARLSGTVFGEFPLIFDAFQAATVCNVFNAAINIILEGKGPRDRVGTDQKQQFIVNFLTLGIRTQCKVPHPLTRCSVQSYPPEQEFQAFWGKRICVSIARIANQNKCYAWYSKHHKKTKGEHECTITWRNNSVKSNETKDSFTGTPTKRIDGLLKEQIWEN